MIIKFHSQNNFFAPLCSLRSHRVLRVTPLVLNSVQLVTYFDMLFFFLMNY